MDATDQPTGALAPRASDTPAEARNRAEWARIAEADRARVRALAAVEVR